jgi:hypothetical protein
MIVQFGRGDESAYGKWDDDPRVFISRPYFKVVLDNGLGFYILNAFKYNLFPKFYGTFTETFCEFGVSFAGWIFEVMWNKAFKV